MANQVSPKSWWTPNATLSRTSSLILIAVLICASLLLWQSLKPTVFPSPIEVLLAFPTLWSDGIMEEVWNSFSINLEAVVLCAIVGLPLCYLTRIPILTSVTAFLTKLRFAGSAVFYLPLTLILPTTHEVKVGLLMLGQLFCLVTTMKSVVEGLEEFRYDDARTLRMSEWLSLWYVNVRGTIPQALDTIRDNAGMSWSMLMFVEGVIRSEGGVGVILMNAQRQDDYDKFFATVILVVLVGIGQDFALAKLKKVICPYA